MVQFWLFLLVMALAGAGALAQNPKLTQTVDKPANSSDRNESVGATVISPEEAESTREYWTRERMRNAKEKPLIPAERKPEPPNPK
jgi:hypothetical protein